MPVGPVYEGPVSVYDDRAEEPVCEADGTAVLDREDVSSILGLRGWRLASASECLGARDFFRDEECVTEEGTMRCGTSDPDSGTVAYLEFTFATRALVADHYETTHTLHLAGTLEAVDPL